MAGSRRWPQRMALSHNEYKIQLAQVAVKRAILRAAGLETGAWTRRYREIIGNVTEMDLA